MGHQHMSNINPCKKLVVVLGMHRSGTSAITRALTTMGVELGDSLMTPMQSVNDKGFFEDIDFMSLNEELLQACGRSWFSLEPIQLSEATLLCNRGYLQKAIQLLTKKVSTHQFFGLKDPRTAKLLPFWSRVFSLCDLHVQYLLVFRHPMSVQQSLKLRDRFESVLSYYLWADHTLAALIHTQGMLKIIVDYDGLIDDPHNEILRIARQLEATIDQEALELYQKDFLEKSLRHTHFKLEDLEKNDDIPVIVKKIYRFLLEKVKTSDLRITESESALIQTWQEEINEIGPVLRLVDRQQNQITELNAEIIRRGEWALGLKDEIAHLNIDLKQKEDQITELNAETIRRGEWALGLKDEIAHLNIDLKQKDNQITELNAETIRHGEWALGLKDEIAHLNIELKQKENQITDLNAETVRRGEWALGLKAELKNEQEKLRLISSSNSWLITLPLRELRRWISSPRKQTKKYLKKGLSLTKKSYQALPISIQTKTKHRNLISKIFPQLLAVTNSPLSTITHFIPPQQNVSLLSNLAATDPTETANSLSFPTYDQPFVSILIPVYGQIHYTLQCLTSITRYLPEIPFEIIIIDDCSPDHSVKFLSLIKGIRLLKNDDNQGFIRSCNTGASVAKGQYLYFLNNDTEVTAGWLEALLRTFYELPGTGLAGSKLVYPDGRLQEAGGIIWQDGSAWNFGRHQDPLLPIYNYAREVDYCSGASMMVPTALFKELGGFDEHYLPAYCEDADLALQIRAKGYRVIYQPLSTVIHFEGITSGTDTTQGTKAYQVVNTEKLFTRWKERLTSHQISGQNVDQAKDRTVKRRVLVLDHCTPTPDQDSGSIDAYNHMLLLREMGFLVTFIPEDNYLYVPDYTPALQRVGIEMLYAPYVTSVSRHLKEFGQRYDLVFVSRPVALKRNLALVRRYCPNAKLLFHTVDLHFLRLSREAELTQSEDARHKARQMKELELQLIRHADITTVVSAHELSILRKELPDHKIRLLPYARLTQSSKKGFLERRDIVFVGSYQHTPNVDAVKFFTQEILPLVRQSLFGVKFYVVGSKPPLDVKELACEDIIITDFIPDLTPLLNSVRLSVAPLRYGAGIKGKIGGAMAVGLPVVATPIAAEGMSLTHGVNILIAEDPKAFADQITTLYQDENLWDSLSKNSLTFAERVWGAEPAWNILANTLADIDITVTRNSNPLSLYTDRSAQF